MDNELQAPTSKQKSSNSKYTSIRVTRTSANTIRKTISAANKKDYGEILRPCDLVDLLVQSINSDTINQLQEQSMSEQDKFDRDYKNYCSQYKKVTKDEFYKLVRQGQIFSASSSQEAGE